jgi:hypothetical protein
MSEKLYQFKCVVDCHNLIKFSKALLKVTDSLNLPVCFQSRDHVILLADNTNKLRFEFILNTYNEKGKINFCMTVPDKKLFTDFRAQFMTIPFEIEDAQIREVEFEE